MIKHCIDCGEPHKHERDSTVSYSKPLFRDENGKAWCGQRCWGCGYIRRKARQQRVDAASTGRYSFLNPTKRGKIQ